MIDPVLLADIADEVSTHPACSEDPEVVRMKILNGEKISQDPDGALRNAVIGLCQDRRPRPSPSEINDAVLPWVFVDGGKKLT